MQDVIDAYSEYANKAEKMVIACGDDPYTRKMLLDKPIVFYGIESDNDIKVVEHKLSDIKILVRDNNQNQPSKNDKANDKNNAKPNKK